MSFGVCLVRLAQSAWRKEQSAERKLVYLVGLPQTDRALLITPEER